ncbi:hypothetical protein [Methylobacillus flagellatus]|uniref:hypothetical protein n=1 Tax=Methylobacillus flagellatus TaxID=405 RepID=UPI0002FA16BB|nr:hypothetical protein [Methylobacillus flagellatus]
MKKFEVMAKAGFYQIMHPLSALTAKDKRLSAAARDSMPTRSNCWTGTPLAKAWLNRQCHAQSA